ncbi:DUF1542 domain-containing protein, partial [Staphylococcus epidermidis]|uniref:DUF1542 domain-containing protein n=1 Tax=Staphylococcus epidermidis TaxID=1282 RepID=UPI0011A437F2
MLEELERRLINGVSGWREINDKGEEMSDGVYDSRELSSEEKDRLVDEIENDKNEICNNIDDEVRDDGV